MRYGIIAVLVFLCTAVGSMGADLTLPSGMSVPPGEQVTLAVTLTNPAPAGGVTVSLESSDTSTVTVNPQNIYIAGGSTTPSYLPRLTGVNFGSATITASSYGLIGASTTVQVATTLISPGSLTIQRGSTVNATFVLVSPTPAALTLTVSSDNPGIASVPSSVTIPV